MREISLYVGIAQAEKEINNFGGWAASLIYKNFKKEISGAGESYSENRLYLSALISGLEAIKVISRVNIYVCDNIYAELLKVAQALNIGDDSKFWKKFVELKNKHNVKIYCHKDQIMEEVLFFASIQKEKQKKLNLNPKTLDFLKEDKEKNLIKEVTQKKKTNSKGLNPQILKKVEIYTDGSCSGNIKNSPGGWGGIIVKDKKETIFAGSEINTNSNRMELKAVVEGIKALKEEPSEITIKSDSRYVVDAINKHLDEWKKNGWKHTSKNKVKERDLWDQYIKYSKIHKIKAIWIKGHNGNIMNERCDQIAVIQRKIKNNKEK